MCEMSFWMAVPRDSMLTILPRSWRMVLICGGWRETHRMGRDSYTPIWWPMPPPITWCPHQRGTPAYNVVEINLTPTPIHLEPKYHI